MGGSSGCPVSLAAGPGTCLTGHWTCPQSAPQPSVLTLSCRDRASLGCQAGRGLAVPCLSLPSCWTAGVATTPGFRLSLPITTSE